MFEFRELTFKSRYLGLQKVFNNLSKSDPSKGPLLDPHLVVLLGSLLGSHSIPLLRTSFRGLSYLGQYLYFRDLGLFKGIGCIIPIWVATRLGGLNTLFWGPPFGPSCGPLNGLFLGTPFTPI
jgi:hypothetical protein